MRQSSIWVLIANDNDAAIWTSQGGTSQLLRSVKRDAMVSGGDATKRTGFAWKLMSELSAGVNNQTCGGVIIIAGEEMLQDLRRVTIPEIKRLLVAEIAGAPATLSAIPTEPVSVRHWGTIQ